MKNYLLKFNFISIFALLLAACTAPTTPQAQPTLLSATPQPSTPHMTDTPLPTSTPEPSSTMATSTPTLVVNTPTPTMNPLATFPLELTQTPGIMATVTAYAATATADYLKNSALFGSLADMMGIMQYFNPVGTPVTSWHTIPVMLQATAGQEFKMDIYSYKATTTLDKAAQFYTDQATSLNWPCNPAVTSSAGTGITADHSTTFTCQGFIISLTSFDNDTSHVIVVLNKAP
jgi:hypothetical protein